MANKSSTKYWVDDVRALPEIVTTLERKSQPRMTENRAFLRNFYQRVVTTLLDDPGRRFQNDLRSFEDLNSQRDNLTAELVGAAAAMLCRPMQCRVTPVATTFEVRQLCKQLGRLSDGIDDEIDQIALAQRAVIDGLVMDVGFTEYYIDPATLEIKGERANALSVLWDDEEGEEPLSLIRNLAVSKRALAAAFPNARDQIMKQAHYREPYIIGVDRPRGTFQADTIRLVRAQARKVGNTRGLYVQMLEDGTVLARDKTDWEKFTLVPFRWEHDHTGYGGVSLARRVAADHSEYNKLRGIRTRALAGAIPRLLEHQDDEEAQGVSDLEFERVKWSGTHPPVMWAPSTVSPDTWKALDAVRARAYEKTGLNQQAAQGNLSAGITSKPGQRERVEVINMRFLQHQERYQRYYRQGTEVKIMLAATAYATKPARVKAPGTRELELIKFPKKLKENQYRVSMSMTSGLSLTFGGKLDQLKEINEVKPMDPGVFLRALGIPDVEGEADLLTSAADVADWMISKALDGVDVDGERKPKFVMPSATQGVEGLNVLLTRATAGYNRARFDGITPREYLECCRRLIKATEARLKVMSPPPTAPAPVPTPPAGEAPPAPV